LSVPPALPLAGASLPLGGTALPLGGTALAIIVKYLY
jgi:hypothetical protein